MKRRLFNITAGISLALFLASAILWLLSHVIQNNFSRQREIYSRDVGPDVLEQLILIPGRVWYDRRTLYRPAPPPQRGTIQGSRLLWNRTLPGIELSEHEHISGKPPNQVGYSSRLDIYVHIALPTTILAILPALWAIRNARRPNRPGHCAVCGYDLRATPDRCPECGAIPRQSEAMT